MIADIPAPSAAMGLVSEPRRTKPPTFSAWLKPLALPFPTGGARAHHDAYWLAVYAAQLTEAGWLEPSWTEPRELRAALMNRRADVHMASRRVNRMCDIAVQTYTRSVIALEMEDMAESTARDLGLSRGSNPGTYEYVDR